MSTRKFAPLMVLVFGFMLKDSVDQALNRRQLELSAASEIQHLVEKTASSNLTEARAAAVTLASFGDFAAVALARALQDAGTGSAIAAEDGLRSLALTGSEEAWEALLQRRQQQWERWRWV